jgi:hypothetical protein
MALRCSSLYVQRTLHRRAVFMESGGARGPTPQIGLHLCYFTVHIIRKKPTQRLRCTLNLKGWVSLYSLYSIRIYYTLKIWSISPSVHHCLDPWAPPPPLMISWRRPFGLSAPPLVESWILPCFMDFT